VTEDQVVNFLYMEDEIATGDEEGSWCVYTLVLVRACLRNWRPKSHGFMYVVYILLPTFS